MTTFIVILAALLVVTQTPGKLLVECVVAAGIISYAYWHPLRAVEIAGSVVALGLVIKALLVFERWLDRVWKPKRKFLGHWHSALD